MSIIANLLKWCLILPNQIKLRLWQSINLSYHRDFAILYKLLSLLNLKLLHLLNKSTYTFLTSFYKDTPIYFSINAPMHSRNKSIPNITSAPIFSIKLVSKSPIKLYPLLPKKLIKQECKSPLTHLLLYY